MQYDNLMKKCIKLAKKGEGHVSPNPLVGCIVLNKDNEIISTGYHKKYGDNHAERDALLKIENNAEKDGTLIVNLEPCTHYGKTPPCTDLIIERGIKRVVIGMKDVNPIVSGKGIKKLKQAGVEVIENVLERECLELNEVFIKNMKYNKTFTAIKTATTLDGKTACANGSSKWITSEKARKEVYKIRKHYDAILTTASTVIADNPTMLHDKKIILDRELKTDKNYQIYKSGKIFLFCDEKYKNTEHKFSSCDINLIYTPVSDNKLDLEFILKWLFDNKIMSVLVESGETLNGEILKYTDKIYHFIAPKITGDNTSKSCFNYRKIDNINECMNFKISEIKKFPPDILLTCYPIV